MYTQRKAEQVQSVGAELNSEFEFTPDYENSENYWFNLLTLAFNVLNEEITCS
jgi:hypothetical protein